MSVASTFSTDGGAALYKEGDLAWYRQRDGTYVPAKVRSDLLGVPSYVAYEPLYAHFPHVMIQDCCSVKCPQSVIEIKLLNVCSKIITLPPRSC